MTHLWVRAEQRDNETRVGITPMGVKSLCAAGFAVTVEDSPNRCIDTADYAAAGATVAPAFSWPEAPKDAIIFGLKELPEANSALEHRHIMFGHAFKGQPSGAHLLRRFTQGGGTLLDLEYLTDPAGKRLAAFGYWAGYAGAALTLKAWIAQQGGPKIARIKPFDSAAHMLMELQGDLVTLGAHRPTALVVGALGRVGSGVIDLCTSLGIPTTKWDMAETASGGPFPEILAHDLFFNCVVARPGTPTFVKPQDVHIQRRLSAIGDIACDPTSDFNPLPIYSAATTWTFPVHRVAEYPPLDMMAIDNLPSLLPVESSEDFAAQLLPVLHKLPDGAAWTEAAEIFAQHAKLAALGKNPEIKPVR